MVKTTPLNDETHKCLKVAQTILYEKSDIQIPIPDIIAAVIYDVDQVVKIVLEKRDSKIVLEKRDSKIVLEKRDIENVDTQVGTQVDNTQPEEEVYAGK